METVKRLIDVQIKEVEERQKSRKGVRTISNVLTGNLVAV